MTLNGKVLLYAIFAFALFLVSVGCKHTRSSTKSSLESLISKKFPSSEAIRELNEPKTHLLVREASAAHNEGLPLAFMVIRLIDNVVVLEGRVSRGYVRWSAPLTLEKFSLPGKVQPDTDLSRYKTQLNIQP